jgi:hypothetical protein
MIPAELHHFYSYAALGRSLPNIDRRRLESVSMFLTLQELQRAAGACQAE